MNPIKRYVNTVERHLRMDRHTRLRIMHDLGSEIQTRLEQGEPPEAILAELGPAAAVAESFNREFAAPPKKSGWRWLLLACAGLAALAAAAMQWVERMLTAAAISVGVIGGADGPTAIFVTAAPSAWRWAEWLPVALGCLAGFLLLQWPGAGKGIRRWLPAALAAAGLALWCLLAVQFALGGTGAASAGQAAAGVACRFFVHGGFVPALALAAAVRRLIQSRGGAPG